MKVKDLLITSVVLLGLISAEGFSMVNASSYPDGIQYQKDSDGNYDPVTNNGKGPALDIGNGKFGRLNKSQAEAWNSGQTGKSNKSESNKSSNGSSYSSKESEPSNNLNNITTSKSKHKAQSTTKHHHSNKPKVRSTKTKSSKSLNVVHAGLIWTGIVLIGAILIYCFINHHRNKIAIKQQQSNRLNTRSRRFKH